MNDSPTSVDSDVDTGGSQENERNVRARTEDDVSLVPHDPRLHDSPMLTITRKISLANLEKEGQPPSDTKYIDAMLLRIIPPTNNENKQGNLRVLSI